MQRELDTFEMQKVRQLAPTLQQAPPNSTLNIAAAKDKHAYHMQQKEMLRLTGGRRPGSKANDVVEFRSQSFVRYPKPLEAGKGGLSVWLADLRALRIHPLTLELRAACVTMPDIVDAWFKHSKQNQTVTMSNAHTALYNFFRDVLGPQAPAYIDKHDCQTFYDRLNDRKQHTMDFGPAMAKLHLLLTPVDSGNWDEYLRFFLSGAFSFIGPLDYVTTFDFEAMLSVFESLIHESEVTLAPVAPAGEATEIARSCVRDATLPMLPSLAKCLKILRGDVSDYNSRQPLGKMLTIESVIALFDPRSAFVKYMKCGAYSTMVAEETARGAEMSNSKKDRERRALLSQVARSRLPPSEKAAYRAANTPQS